MTPEQLIKIANLFIMRSQIISLLVVSDDVQASIYDDIDKIRDKLDKTIDAVLHGAGYTEDQIKLIYEEIGA